MIYKLNQPLRPEFSIISSMAKLASAILVILGAVGLIYFIGLWFYWWTI